MNMGDLDQHQQEVVDTILNAEGTVLVMGGAGTGKTTTALWTARSYLEQSADIHKPRILFLTFSRSAVKQITTRSPGVLSDFSDQIEILTFHGLAYRLIKAFGRYAGYGTSPIVVQSDARTKLLGRDDKQTRYEDLIPGAIRILKQNDPVRNLVASRWGLVICDEVQDTSTEQWELLQLLANRRTLLFGDPHQMIYSSFVPGVSVQQFQHIRASADREISLSPRSHRDPSGVIPSLAEAVRERMFDHEAVEAAISSDRLFIHFEVNDSAHQELLVSEIRKARGSGSRDVGIFVHSNAAVADVADLLNSADVDHSLVGIPEAHAEALNCMGVQCAYAVGSSTDKEIRESLALFTTACVRGRTAPQMALALIGVEVLPDLVDQTIGELELDLRTAALGTIRDVAEVAMRSWRGIGIKVGYRAWYRAAQHFGRLTSLIGDRLADDESLLALQEVVGRTRTEALIDFDYSEQSNVKLMNYHQTKSREADTVIHLYRQGDYFGRGGEPFVEASRLLNVAITRARKRVVIVLPPDPHPLLQPFKELRRLQETVMSNS